MTVTCQFPSLNPALVHTLRGDGRRECDLGYFGLPSGDDVPEPERLYREIARLQEDNEDLRASAVHWLRLYDAALRRANDLEARLVAGNDRTVTAPGRS
jgi:hypothetical protein